MTLSVPTNFDPELPRGLCGYPVREAYGKLRADRVGGGRLASVLPSVSLRDIAHHARQLQKVGIHFNYLLNASHSDNQEFTRRGQRDLAALVDKLLGMGIGRFTVATPYLLKYLKARDSALWVKISVFAQIGDARKAKQWEDLGADELVLDSMLVNRDFERLAEIRRAVGLSLQLLVNNNCTYGCSFSPYHMNVLASGSRAGNPTSALLPDYCYLCCTADKLRNPARFLMADWIRPEDLCHYQELGYDSFKIAGRNVPTGVILDRVKAYSEERYDGNLLDLVQDFGHAAGGVRREGAWRGIGRALSWVRTGAPRRAGVLRKLWELSRHRGFFSSPTIEPPVSIWNRALDGFLLPILQMGGCRDRLCERCRHCHRWADAAVRVRSESAAAILQDQEPLLELMESGGFWR